MCGDIESDETRAEEFYKRFAEHAQAFLAASSRHSPGQPADPLHAYLDSLFHDRLGAAAEQDRAPQPVSGYERLRMEPLVYARLAGFMAAHQPLEDDPLRRLIEALMTGYAEGERIISEHHHEHSHGHSHDHDHGHAH
jgi:hypothetical protein